MRLTFLAIAVAIGSFLCSQSSNPLIQDAEMPAPNAAALGKFTDIPVDLFTGLPSINIPLYSVSDGPLNHSIGLMYHASGIRVAEPVSWVGTGWALSAGGMISRSIKGLPDENLNGYYREGHKIVPYPADGSHDEKVQWKLNVVHRIYDGRLDGEPDLFTISVGGISGKFQFDQNGDIHVINKTSDIAVSHIMSEDDMRFDQFIVTSSTGDKYFFGKHGSNTAYEEQFDGSTSVATRSNWMLMHIESADANYSIRFSYQNESYSYKSPVTAYRSYSNLPQFENDQAFPGSNGYDIVNYHYRNHYTIGKRLISITSSTDSVAFIATNNRLDLSGDSKRLESVIYNSAKGLICSKFSFTYDYFVDTDSEIKYGISKPYFKRLRLTTIQERSCNNSIVKPPYSFQYSGPIKNGKPYLPHRLSKAIDHWGYYNGRHSTNDHPNNKVNIPHTTVPHPSDPGLNAPISYGSANRESSNSHMLYGSLRNITYPTGGSTTYTFEANTVNEQYYIPSTKISNLSTCGTPGAACCGEKSNEVTLTFETEDEINNVVFDLEGANPFYYNSTDGCYSSYRYVKIQIYQGASLYGSYSFSFSSSTASQQIRDKPLSYISSSLQPGVPYRFKISSTNCRGSFSMRTQTIEDRAKVVGGLRIKRILHSDAMEADNAIVKDYTYDEANRGISSGKLRNVPQYVKSSSWVGTVPCGSPEGCTGNVMVVKFSETSTNPLSNFDGRHIGYREVTEHIPGNGSITHKFNYAPISNEDIGIPYSQQGVMWGEGWHNFFAANFSKIHGTENSRKTIAENGQEVKSQLLYYNAGYSIPINNAYGMRVEGYFGYINGEPSGYNNVWQAYVYQPRTGAILINQQITKLDGVEQVTSYTYDNASPKRFHQPKTVTNYGSDGRQQRTDYFYLPEYGASTIRGFLTAQNIIYPAYKSEVYQNGTKVSGQYNSYAWFSNSTGEITNSTTNRFARPSYFYTYQRPYEDGILGNYISTYIGRIKQYHGSASAGKGKPYIVYQPGWGDTEYEWINGLIAKNTFEGHTSEYLYYPGSKLVSRKTEIDGQHTDYTYDKLGRLSSIKGQFGSNNSPDLTVAYSYYYGSGASNPSYVRTTTTFSKISSDNDNSNSQISQQQSFQYVDGLSRPIQTVVKGKAANGQDVASTIAYNNRGLEEKTYEPFITGNTNGSYTRPPSSTPYASKTYHTDPLLRLKSSKMPGPWPASTYSYSTNTTSDYVRMNGTSSYYNSSSLFVSTVIDPDGLTVKTYTDKHGRSVLSRRQKSGTSSKADTYTVYDDLSRVIAILPPGCTSTSSNLAYRYEYNAKGLLLKKWLPDQEDYHSYAYNSRNLLALSQDPNQRRIDKWSATQYDVLGRPTVTGLTGTDSNVNNPSISEVYTTTTYGAAGIEKGKVLSQTERLLGGLSSGQSLNTVYTYDALGRVASTTGNNMINLGTNNAEVISYRYDAANNPTIVTRQHTGPSGLSVTERTRTTYDKWGRSQYFYHKINGRSEHRLAQTNYSHKDQVSELNLGYVNSRVLQSVDYLYLDNRFLSTINAGGTTGTQKAYSSSINNMPYANSTSTNVDYNDLFALDLRYNQLVGALGGTPRSNGNISQVIWQTRGRERQSYTLQYDYLDRLIDAKYQELSASGSAKGSGRFSEQVQYRDDRGNISSILRHGLYVGGSTTYYWERPVDDLTYTYAANSNRITRIDDAARSDARPYGFKDKVDNGLFDYDANGNLKFHPGNNQTITYNSLNLPSQIVQDGSTTSFTYTATGRKVEQVSSAGVRRYLNGLEYLDGQLESFAHPNGRIVSTNGNALNAFRYEYNLTDHLGNVRLVFADLNGNGRIDQTSSKSTNEILQENHYYPFGMTHYGSYSTNTGVGEENRYRYNGKELNEELGLYDYGARWYDPAVGRFTGVDPIADHFPHASTYNYAENEPVGSIDLWGLQRFTVNSGELIGPGVTNGISPITHRPKMSNIQGIVLHRTVSSTAASAVQTTRSNNGRTGFHIVVDKNGSIIQVNNLENRANHVGRPKGNSGLDNYNSIGIEVVGLYLGKDAAGNERWEPLTTDQIEATSKALAAILVEYGLEIGDIFSHEDVSYKTQGEGQTVYNAIISSLYQHYAEQNGSNDDENQSNNATWQDVLDMIEKSKSE